MKKILLFVFAIVQTCFALAQENTPAKIILKNNDVLTGKILEVKLNEHVRIEITGNNVITIPYSEIRSIHLDGGGTGSSGVNESLKEPSETLSKTHFQSIVEGVAGIGIGKVYALPYVNGTVINTATFGGFYIANGIGIGSRFFAGIGLGIYGNGSGPGYSIPYTLDVRYRVLRKKFSPIVMANGGGEYIDGGLGAFTFSEGFGLNIAKNERRQFHAIVTHTFIRYVTNLSIQNNQVESSYGNSYSNFICLRLGVTFKI